MEKQLKVEEKQNIFLPTWCCKICWTANHKQYRAKPHSECLQENCLQGFYSHGKLCIEKRWWPRNVTLHYWKRNESIYYRKTCIYMNIFEDITHRTWKRHRYRPSINITLTYTTYTTQSLIHCQLQLLPYYLVKREVAFNYRIRYS